MDMEGLLFPEVLAAVGPEWDRDGWVGDIGGLEGESTVCNCQSFLPGPVKRGGRRTLLTRNGIPFPVKQHMQNIDDEARIGCYEENLATPSLA